MNNQPPARSGLSQYHFIFGIALLPVLNKNKKPSALKGRKAYFHGATLLGPSAGRTISFKLPILEK